MRKKAINKSTRTKIISKILSRSFFMTSLLFLLSCSNDDGIKPITVIEEEGSDDADLVIWQGSYGGSQGEFIYGLIQSQDGGYLLTGSSSSGASGDKTEDSRGEVDYWIVKLDGSGNIQWDKTLGGELQDGAYNSVETADGGFIVSGFSNSSNFGDRTEPNLGSSDVWLAKLSSSGALIWENAIGGDNGEDGNCLLKTSDGNYIVGGYSSSNISDDKSENSVGGSGMPDFWIVKFDDNGNILWDNTIGGFGDDTLKSMTATNDGGFILAGRSDSEVGADKSEAHRGLSDIWLVKVSSNGAIQWDKTIGGAASDVADTVIQTSDGGYLVGGNSESNISGDKTEPSNGGSDYWILKLSVSGSIEWQKTIGGSEDENCTVLYETADGNFVAAGLSRSGISGDRTEPSRGEYDYWLVRLNPSGEIVDQNVFGSSSSDQLQTFTQTSDGAFIIGGFSSGNISEDKTAPSQGGSDMWVLKVSDLVED